MQPRSGSFTASGRSWRSQLPLLTVIYCCCCLYCWSPCFAQLSLKSEADKLADQLKKVFQNASGFDNLTKIYVKALADSLFKVEASNPLAEVEQLSEQIGKMVAIKTKAIKESVAIVEEVAATYKQNPNLNEIEHAKYLYSKELKDDNPELEYNRKFLQKVATNASAVHIPTDIYRGRNDILNQLTWTQQVDQQFISMAANEEYFNDTVRYMYLATDMGLMRLYPGMKWTQLEGVTSMYDARRTSWFVEGSTCAKDMLLMIDTSGSMHGQNLLLTKQAAKSLINTLGENDYVAVGQYPGKALSAEHTDSPHLLHDKEPPENGNGTCFESLVQATKRHKERLFKQIEGIQAKGLVDLAEALDFAYKTFESYQNGSSNNHGARCSSIIALFTDGDISTDTEKTYNMLRRYKKKNDYLNKVRIFIFSVGEHRNPDGPLIELACSNRGTFTDVPAMGAVTSDVQEGYLTTLRNVGALHEAQLPIESRSGASMVLHSHFDPNGHKTFSFFSENQIRDLGFGVLTSLTMPFYNISGNNSFLGLVGTDIAIKDWVAMVPRQRLGPNGYAFALNANGYVVFHPELRTKNGWHQQPGGLDLLEVELDEPEKRLVRRQVVATLGPEQVAEDAAQQVTVESLRRVPDGVHVHKSKMAYAYKRIPGTPYALSIALPAENAGYVAFDSGIRPAFEQLDGSLWTVSMADGLAAKATYPSPYAAYLVPTDTPYCSEYYTPPPPSPTLSSTGSANDSNSTADPPPPLPSPPPTAPAFDEHHERELTERLRLAPDNLGNLLQTLALNESACNPHWSASLAADLVLLDSFFKSHAMDPPKPWVASVAASGPGGVTGVFPPGEAAQYRAWRDGWSAGHYRRAAQMPDMLFATVPCMSESTYNLSTVVSTAAPQATRTTTAVADIFGLSSVNSSWPTSPTLGPGPLDVTLYQAVTVKDFSIAVLGVTLSGRWLAETVFTGPFADLCSPDGDNHTCYLVEDGGYIVSANDGSTETVGHFLGTVDKPLMRHLVFNLSVFASVQEYDFQGICRNDLPADPHFSKAAPAGPGPNRLALAVAAAASLLALRTGQQQPEFQLLPRQPLLMTAMATLTLPSLTEGNVLPKGPTFDCIKKGYRYYRDFSVVPRTVRRMNSAGVSGWPVCLAPTCCWWPCRSSRVVCGTRIWVGGTARALTTTTSCCGIRRVITDRMCAARTTATGSGRPRVTGRIPRRTESAVRRQSSRPMSL
ncbi:hypothetical protein BOX15_Mlig011769g1 [Macrostomum lignano]|uniref:VWFA domain-containing protein n=2 Tax=Macrostomum lignano TaxID=282301 RepID=A0A267F2P7_9PLAT|nr:hypothetical protein BOX15_Mlig011769g1 [Macrostomum lignano]